jgi:hypothetical protein
MFKVSWTFFNGQMLSDKQANWRNLAHFETDVNAFK